MFVRVAFYIWRAELFASIVSGWFVSYSVARAVLRNMKLSLYVKMLLFQFLYVLVLAVSVSGIMCYQLRAVAVFYTYNSWQTYCLQLCVLSCSPCLLPIIQT